MTGDVDEEVGGDNDENALDWGDGAAWWDSHCENAVSSDFVKTNGVSVAKALRLPRRGRRGKSGTLEFGKISGSCRDRNRSPEAQRS
jgi:hypothetical protein